MPLLLLSEQTLNAKVQQPQSLPYLRCNIPRKALQECQQPGFELMPPLKELRAPRHGNRQQCEGRVEKQEGSQVPGSPSEPCDGSAWCSRVSGLLVLSASRQQGRSCCHPRAREGLELGLLCRGNAEAMRRVLRLGLEGPAGLRSGFQPWGQAQHTQGATGTSPVLGLALSE